MFTMPATRREAARVDAFVAAIRTSAHPNRRPVVAHDDTIALPRIVAVASTRPEPDEPALIDRLPVVAIVAVFVALFAPLVILLGVDTGTALTPGTDVLPSHTVERVVELGNGRVTR